MPDPIVQPDGVVPQGVALARIDGDLRDVAESSGSDREKKLLDMARALVRLARFHRSEFFARRRLEIAHGEDRQG